MQKCKIVDVDESIPSHLEYDDENVAENNTVGQRNSTSRKPKQSIEGPVPHLKAFQERNYHDVINGGGWQGWHCEGSVVRLLFGILMWETFFSPIDKVFVTQYQDSPLDFPYTSFFQAR
jgi:hypothetical protein